MRHALGLVGPSIRLRAVLAGRSHLCCQAHPAALARRAISTSWARKASSEAAVRKIDDDEIESIAQRKQEERPWHRAGSEGDKPEEATAPTEEDKRRGRLLTTPTRLLKLILPLPYHIDQQRRKDSPEVEKDDIQPLALLVHPQQPLSYLERLLQAEIPPIEVDGNFRVPNIQFRAEADQSNSGEDSKKKDKSDKEEKDENQDRQENVSTNGNNDGPGNVASYSGLGHEGPSRDHTNWVRWSGSTEVGDFIRDAARGREFAIAIEGYGPQELRVAVPSFNDRTYYLRVRLRKMSRRIDALAHIKRECDQLAHRGAHRLAQGGFALMAGWWGTVYYVTFHTDFGWDFVEPVTYLAGLTTIMGGYLWFLYISRDLSYKAALNITVSRRQNALYQARGFDAQKWESLVHEANALRREIRVVAEEYDVEWDETRDLGSEKVKKVLERERKDKRKRQGKKDDEDEDDDDDEREKEKHAQEAKQKELAAGEKTRDVEGGRGRDKS